MATTNIIINEEWRSVDGFINYQVSNLGRVRNANTGRILKPCVKGNGYYAVILYKMKKGIQKSIHRLVAEEFIENQHNKPCVDHIDGHCLNNMLTNLRWVTTQENKFNTRGKKPSTSQYKGVCLNATTSSQKKWRADIKVNGKHITIGRYYTEIEAAKAYNEYAKEYFGEFAKLNKID